MITENKTGKQALVTIECECIRTTGEECDRVIEVRFAPQHPVSGRTYTKTQRVSRARQLAKEKGWLTHRGVDECPRVHRFIPLPAPKQPKEAG